MPKRVIEPQKAANTEVLKLPPALAEGAKKLLLDYQRAQAVYKNQLDLMVSSYLIGKGYELGDNDVISLSDDHTTVILLRKEPESSPKK